MRAIGRKTVGKKELFRNQCRHHCFSQTDHIREEETIVFHHFGIAIVDSIHLIGQLFVAVGQIRDRIGVKINALAKILQQKLQINLVRREVKIQIGFLLYLLNMCQIDFHRLFPKPFKGLSGKLNIIIITQLHIEFEILFQPSFG